LEVKHGGPSTDRERKSTVDDSLSDIAGGAQGINGRLRFYGYVIKALQLGPLLILIVIALIMFILTPTFGSEANIQNLLIQSSIVGVLAVAELLVIVTGGIDLSVAATAGLVTLVGYYAYQTKALHNGLLVLIVMIGVGLIFGLANVMIYVFGKVPHPFVVTLATLSVAEGLSLMFSQGEIFSGMPGIVVSLGNGYAGPIPMPAIVLAIVVVAGWWLTRRTQWGRWIFATGGNREGAKRVGIPVNRILISVYALSGVCAGIAGVLAAGATDGASPTLGEDPTLLLNAIAGVIIGGASLFGGRGSVRNALVGALIIGAIEDGLALLNASPYAENVFIGLIILAAVELDVVRANLERRIRTMQSNLARI
jgi:ribose transport system permease protein